MKMITNNTKILPERSEDHRHGACREGHEGLVKSGTAFGQACNIFLSHDRTRVSFFDGLGPQSEHRFSRSLQIRANLHIASLLRSLPLRKGTSCSASHRSHERARCPVCVCLLAHIYNAPASSSTKNVKNLSNLRIMPKCHNI